MALILLQGGITWILLGLGAFFVIFYTWPLKYIGLGEIAVLIVWGPLMIGGGYYVITGTWEWNVLLASLPYALGVTGVIFGKHIDKFDMDKERGIHTLPVILGEKILSIYCLGHDFPAVYPGGLPGAHRILYPLMLIVFFSITVLLQIIPMFRNPKPDEKPADYPDVWPNYFVAGAFVHNRRFGLLFVLGLVLDTVAVYVIRNLL